MIEDMSENESAARHAMEEALTMANRHGSAGVIGTVFAASAQTYATLALVEAVKALTEALAPTPNDHGYGVDPRPRPFTLES